LLLYTSFVDLIACFEKKNCVAVGNATARTKSAQQAMLLRLWKNQIAIKTAFSQKGFRSD